MDNDFPSNFSLGPKELCPGLSHLHIFLSLQTMCINFLKDMPKDKATASTIYNFQEERNI